MSRQKLLIWLIVALALLNIATISTIIFHVVQEKQQNLPAINTGNGNMLNGRFFRNEIGFNNEQMENFRTYYHPFRVHTKEIVVAIDSLKSKLFEELQEENPDTLIIKNLSAQIGDLHGTLKEVTAKFYLQIKETATEEQKQALNKAFYPLFANEAGQRCQNRRGRGNNRNTTN